MTCLAFRQQLARGKAWWLRAVHDENIFLILLGVRWLGLIPPALALLGRRWDDPAADRVHLLVFGAALLNNFLLSVLYPRVNRLLVRQPAMLGIDMALAAVFIALTGGTTSPYYFYGRAPLLAAAFFFRIRGGLLAAAAYTPLYLLAVMVSHRLNHDTLEGFDIISTVDEILIFFMLAFVVGYPSLLLQRLRLAQQELAHAETLAALGKMAAKVSHEIRNPLSSIGGFARSILRKPHDLERVRGNAQIIADEAQRLEQLLNDMLEIARPPQLDMRCIDLHAILDKAWLLASGASSDRSTVIIQKEYDKSLPLIEADGAALLRAFLNVLRNAVQAMPEGGVLTVSTLARDNEAQVAIADTGPGIAAEVVPTLFKAFISHRAHGTGLGLAVTHEIIQQHGGSIEVQSEVGKGARFIFSLPVKHVEVE